MESRGVLRELWKLSADNPDLEIACMCDETCTISEDYTFMVGKLNKVYIGSKYVTTDGMIFTEMVDVEDHYFNIIEGDSDHFQEWLKTVECKKVIWLVIVA